MIAFNLLYSRQPDIPPQKIYDGIVSCARQPALYLRYGIPDTVDGRFDMIILHLVLLCRYLRGSEAGKARSQEVFDLFFKDMDSNLREMGATDIGVPKKIKKMAQAFYGRAAHYVEALDKKSHQELKEALQRNIFPDQPDIECSALTDYVESTAEYLTRQPFEKIMIGDFQWPQAQNGE